MKNIWKWILVVVAIIIMIMVLTSKSKTESNTQVIENIKSEQELTVALHPWIGNGLYYVAEEKGFFEKHGVQVNLQDYLDGAVGKQLMASGQVDALGALTPETLIILADSGVDAKIVAITDISEGADGVIVDASINSLEDLKGKKVAFEGGSPSQFFFEYLLAEVGMTSNDVEVVDMPSMDAGAAFVSGAVDAAVTWEPWLSQSSDRPGGKTLVNSKDVPILPGMLIARDESINTKSAELAKLTAALFEAGEWIGSNQDEAADIMARRFAIPKQDVVDQYSTFRFLTLKENLDSFNGTGQVDVYDLMSKAKKIWFDMGFLQGKVSIDTKNLATDKVVKMVQ